MRNAIKMVALLAFLGNREALAQTVGMTGSPSAVNTPLKLTQDSASASVGVAPIGHRQPRVRDLPPEAVGGLERLSAEDSAVDQKLIICRGC